MQYNFVGLPTLLFYRVVQLSLTSIKDFYCNVHIHDRPEYTLSHNTILAPLKIYKNKDCTHYLPQLLGIIQL